MNTNEILELEAMRNGALAATERKAMKRWTESEVADLRRLKPTKTNRELAEIFGTTAGAVAAKCNEMGIKRGGQPREIRLTRQQKLWLKLNFPHMANCICAMFLGISQRSVVRQARRLGLSKTAQFMKEAQAHAVKKAQESHLKNGTYPPKGFIIPGSEAYRFKPGHANLKRQEK